MVLFDSHRDDITTFSGILVFGWTVALKTWNTTRDSEDAGRRDETENKASTDQTSRCPIQGEETNLDMPELDTISLEEVGMDEGLTTYEKMWEASASAHSIDMPQAFWMGLFLKTISRR